MKHELRLQPGPFAKIKAGTKTVELRLYDEKRRKIKVGDILEFTNLESAEKLLVDVISLEAYPSFSELYKHYAKVSLGYNELDTADPADMEKYYSKEEQEKHEVVAIGIKLVKRSEEYIG